LADSEQVERPQEDKLVQQQITLRDGNIAYEIHRELFENKDNSIEIVKLKGDFLKKVSPAD
jgi:hypothetical protein